MFTGKIGRSFVDNQETLSFDHTGPGLPEDPHLIPEDERILLFRYWLYAIRESLANFLEEVRTTDGLSNSAKKTAACIVGHTILSIQDKMSRWADAVGRDFEEFKRLHSFLEDDLPIALEKLGYRYNGPLDQGNSPLNHGDVQ
jgi:hypothetical protein